MAYHRLQRFFRFWIKGVIGQVVGVEVGFDGLEIAMPLLMTLVPFLMLRNSSLFDHILQLPLQLKTFSGRRYDYWGRPSCFARNCLLI
jgi:hypothetical protein